MTPADSHADAFARVWMTVPNTQYVCFGRCRAASADQECCTSTAHISTREALADGIKIFGEFQARHIKELPMLGSLAAAAASHRILASRVFVAAALPVSSNSPSRLPDHQAAAAAAVKAPTGSDHA